MLHILLLLLLGTASAAVTNCTRHALNINTKRYIAALATGQHEWLESILTPNTTYSQNLEPAPIAKVTISATPLTISYHCTTYDTVECATHTEILVTNSVNPYMIATQLRFNPLAQMLASVDTIVTVPGDLLFNATHALHYYLALAQPEDQGGSSWGISIAPEKQDSRAVLQSAADAYYDVFSNKSVVVPWGQPCMRLEGGYLDANGTCDMGIPDVTAKTENRRYVIDEHVGSVAVLSNFGILGPDVHEFRIAGGKIFGIRSMTVCKEKDDCGLSPPEGLREEVGW